MKINVALVLAFFALVCFAQAATFNLEALAKSANLGASFPFYHVGNSSAECESSGDCLDEGDDGCSLNCTLADGNCCPLGTFCYIVGNNSADNATCESNNVDDWCNSDFDCFGTYGNVPGGNIIVAYSYFCEDNACAVKYFPGDTCESNDDCNTALCNTDDNVCVGFANNTACTFGAGQCAYGLTCSALTGKCTGLAAEDEACKYDTDCWPGYACISGNCTEAFSADSGAKCSSGIQCDDDYVCSPSSGTCVDGTEWETSSCDSDSDCDDGGSCWCSKITGEQFCVPNTTVTTYNNGLSALSDVYECVRDNNCTNFGMAPNSCVMQNCESDAENTFDTDCDFADDSFGDCYYNASCGGFPVWAIVVIVIVAVVLVLVIVVVIVMAMRKRRQYDTIA